MLWSQFSAIFANFRRKKIGVFLKNQCYDQNLAQFSFVLSQKRQYFFAEFFGENFLKSWHRSLVTLPTWDKHLMDQNGPVDTGGPLLPACIRLVVRWEIMATSGESLDIKPLMKPPSQKLLLNTSLQNSLQLKVMKYPDICTTSVSRIQEILVSFLLKNTFEPMALFLFVSIQTMHIKSIVHTSNVLTS
jgi:hypothetical protein